MSNKTIDDKPQATASKLERLVRFKGKYSLTLGLFWVVAIFTIAAGDPREQAACLGAAAGWIGFAMEENKNKT